VALGYLTLIGIPYIYPMTGSRLRYLDGLRGVLAIIVFVHHFFYIFYPDIIFGGNYQEYQKPGWSFDKIFAFTPLNLLFNPGAAIHFFFLLSGYVQSFHYFNHPEITILQKSFFKRYFRLTIPVLAVLLIVYACHSLHLIRKDLIPVHAVTEGFTKSTLPNKYDLREVIRAALVVHVYLKNYTYYQVLWTMPIELMNSWMVFILLFVGHQVKNIRKLLLFWIVVQLFFLQAFYSVAFTLGMLLCYFQTYSAPFKDLFTRSPVRILCFTVGLYFASYPFVGYEKSTVNTMYGPISFFEKHPHIISYLVGDLLLFCFIMYSSRLTNLLSKPIFIFFGNISFMFYLFHFILLFTFSPVFYAGLPSMWNVGLKLGLTGISSFIVTTAISYLLYQFIDKPGIHWSSVITKKVLGI
jgi:peptidoglycan/LPS O-acetylase OafA/YrhL